MKQSILKSLILGLLLMPLTVSGQYAPQSTLEKQVKKTAIVDTILIDSKFIPAGTTKVVVAVPDDSIGKTYPVVYLLHGFAGDYSDWTNRAPRVKDVAQEKGIILVMPDGYDSWYWDSPLKPEMKMESYITQQLVPYIDEHYPTIPDAKHRAITGLSMGGQGAMWLGLRHPDLFGSIATMSGGVDIVQFPDRWHIRQHLGEYRDNPQAWQARSIVNLAETIEPTGQNILIDCGVDDYFADVNKHLHQVLLQRGIPHDYTERPGKHSWDYWRNSVLYHLLFFSEAFRD